MFEISMTTTLTENGVMVKEGDVIAHDVCVRHHMVDHSLSITYYDTNNCLQSFTKSIPSSYNLIRNSKDGEIMGVLPRHDESWYLFWNS